VAPATADDLEQGLKVAYLYNFTHFVAWPETSLGRHFQISVLGDPDMAQALLALERQQKQAQRRPIRIHRAVGPNDPAIDDAQILFVGKAAVDRLPAILQRTRDRPVLLVGDSHGLAERGVGINFFLQPDILGGGERLRFEINPKALAGRGLRVSAQLYDVAEIVQ